MHAKTEDMAAGHAAAVEALRDVPQIPGASKPDPILIVDHVSRQFGGLKAVDVAHVEIQRGAITALIGPNGAGKTTLFNLLTGFDKPDGGTWTFNDQSVAGLAPYRLARMGMVRTFQLTKALSRMSVMDNMLLGANGQSGERVFQALLPFIWGGQERGVPEVEAWRCSVLSLLLVAARGRRDKDPLMPCMHFFSWHTPVTGAFTGALGSVLIT